MRLWVYNAEIFSGGSSNLWKPVGFVAKQNSDFWFFWDTLMWVVQTLLPYIIYIYKYIRLPTHEDTPSKIRPPPPPSPLTLPPPANSLIEVCSQLWDQRGGGVGAGSIITDTQLSPSMQLSKLGVVYNLSHNHPNFSAWLLSHIFTNIYYSSTPSGEAWHFLVSSSPHFSEMPDHEW